MPKTFGINHAGVKPCPIDEEHINFEDYPVKCPDWSATCTTYTPLFIQFGGIGMMEMEKQ